MRNILPLHWAPRERFAETLSSLNQDYKLNLDWTDC